MQTIILLTISNVFMTAAWYGHLKFKSLPLVTAILVSWGIAFVEYCFQVPANRIGHERFTASQLKLMQEVITLVVFTVFAITFLKQPPRWNELLGFVLVLAAVAVGFGGKPKSNEADSAAGTTVEASTAVTEGNRSP